MTRRVVYCDASVTSEGGHFVVHCRNITRSLRQQGIETLVLVHRDVDPALASSLGAQPFFAAHTWQTFSKDPLCGWLVSFEKRWQSCLADLQRIQGLTGEDVVYYELAVPAQITALSQWAQRFGDPASCPQISMSVGEHAGLIPNRLPDGSVNWTLGDISAILYRYAGLALPEAFAQRFRFMTFHRKTAELHAALLGRPVEVVPMPLDPQGALRPRRAKDVLNVGFLGAQRANKGFHLVPEIISRLLASRNDVSVVVQNSWNHMHKEMQTLRDLEAKDKRLQLISRGLTGAEWASLIDEIDIVVAPYDQSAYASGLSGITVEAIMNGIPSAVPRWRRSAD